MTDTKKSAAGKIPPAAAEKGNGSAAGKESAEKTSKEEKKDDLPKDEILDKETGKSAEVKKTGKPVDAKKKAILKEIAERCGVDEIFENTKGEFFTNSSYALHSEAGNKEKVIKHKV